METHLGNKRLAIVIPAYKESFLRNTLDSIANQTCKEFSLYIGDDCSPYLIGKIVDEYRDKIDITYKRFDTNLGGKDLAAQWERCIDMSQGEPYIWLFSDDDVMEPECVEKFYEALEKKPSDFYHFNIKKIYEASASVDSLPIFPRHLSTIDFINEKYRGRIVSYVVEFVFSRKLYELQGKFQKFDMAWGSDFITWIKFSQANDGIDTIEGPCVRWRSSSQNISPDKSRITLLRKMRAEMMYLKWIKDFMLANKYGYGIKYYKVFFGNINRLKKFLTKTDGFILTNEFSQIMNVRAAPFFFKVFWFLVKGEK